MPPASPLGRVVEIAEEGRHLLKERGFLVVEAGGEELGRVPLDDIAALVATARGTSLTTSLIAALAERGTPVVLCGANFAPVALVFPLAGHHAQQRRMEAQLAATRPLAKRLWAQVVAAKLRAQAAALASAGLPSAALARLARSVRSGDPENAEAQGARRYWPLMMGEGSVATRRCPGRTRCSTTAMRCFGRGWRVRSVPRGFTPRSASFTATRTIRCRLPTT